jgi:hypothetical protein
MTDKEKLKALLAELDKMVMRLYIKASGLSDAEYIRAKQTYQELDNLVKKYQAM